MPLNSNSKNSGVPNTLFGPNSKLSILFVSCQISAINFHQINMKYEPSVTSRPPSRFAAEFSSAEKVRLAEYAVCCQLAKFPSLKIGQ